MLFFLTAQQLHVDLRIGFQAYSNTSLLCVLPYALTNVWLIVPWHVIKSKCGKLTLVKNHCAHDKQGKLLNACICLGTCTFAFCIGTTPVFTTIFYHATTVVVLQLLTFCIEAPEYTHKHFKVFAECDRITKDYFSETILSS